MSDSIKSLIKNIVAVNKLQGNFLEDAYNRLSSSEKDDLSRYLEFCDSRGVGLDYLAEAYNTIVGDTLREQIYFQRHKKYRYSTFKEVAESVYFNPEYMKRYMYGLALTAFFWAQHKAIKNYFEAVVPKSNKGKYLEIGPGHGYFMAKAMSTTNYDSFLGVDISPTSIELSGQVLDSEIWGGARGYELVHADFLDQGFTGKYDAIVMGEVLEHVEAPVTFLKKIKELAHDDTFIFVTTCINSPAVDHIALFKNVDDIKAIISSAGLQIADYNLVPYDKLDEEESQKRELPMNIAFVLKV